MSADKIARMANQIALFMESKPHEEALAGLSAHINDFWEPRMRAQLFALLDRNSPDLRPLVHQAAARIRRPQPA
jgi:formate dehydrogenase subunit delta